MGDQQYYLLQSDSNKFHDNTAATIVVIQRPILLVLLNENNATTTTNWTILQVFQLISQAKWEGKTNFLTKFLVDTGANMNNLAGINYDNMSSKPKFKKIKSDFVLMDVHIHST